MSMSAGQRWLKCWHLILDFSHCSVKLASKHMSFDTEWTNKCFLLSGGFWENRQRKGAFFISMLKGVTAGRNQEKDIFNNHSKRNIWRQITVSYITVRLSSQLKWSRFWERFTRFVFMLVQFLRPERDKSQGQNCHFVFLNSTNKCNTCNDVLYHMTLRLCSH